MDIVIDLIQQVVRGFYDVKAVIVMDAILQHHVLSDRDLTTMMGLPAKDLRSVCARLKEDHLLRDISHKDDASRDRRAFTQTYYYIHYTEAVDAIKWKMYSVENKLKEEMDAQHNPHDYVCDNCGARYTTMDAVSLLDPERGVFVCEVCGNDVREDDGPGPQEGGTAQDRKGELMTQLQPLITALRKIDDLTIPENTFQSEQQRAIPLPQSEPEGLPKDDDLPSARQSSLPQPVQATFQVQITSDAERLEQEKANAEEKKRLLEENALPEWHVKSTVGKGLYDSSGVKQESDAGVKTESGQVKTEAETEESAMEAYYRKMKEAQNDQSDEDDEEADEFDDII